MSTLRSPVATLAVLAAVGLQSAAALEVQVQDTHEQALADAVVFARPLAAAVSVDAAATAVIDQIDKTFVPRVSAIRAGTTVSFPNKDDIKHHVYSFSPPKVFQLKLYHGLAAAPVTFEQPGLVVLGCNIHDGMIAYLYVVDAPHFALTDAQGVARLDGLPAGDYALTAWHYQMDDSAQGSAGAQHTVGAAAASPILRLALRPDSPLPPPLE